MRRVRFRVSIEMAGLPPLICPRLSDQQTVLILVLRMLLFWTHVLGAYLIYNNITLQ